MKKFDRVLITLLTIGVWFVIFIYVFSPYVSKARDPFFDDNFGNPFEDIFEGYVFKGNVSVKTMPSGETDNGMIECKVITR